MQILDRLWGPQVRNLGRALDRTSERHSLLSENIANTNVPGYQRRDVDFAVELESASSRTSGLDRIAGKMPEPASSAASRRLDGNSVDMEQEVVALGETELRYQMLTEIVGRTFSGLKNVIREGR